MAGRRIVICRQRAYSLNGVISTSQTIEIARYVRVSEFAGGVLEVRLHQKGTWTTGTTCHVIAEAVSPAEDEPQTLFLGSAIATVVIQTTDVAPKLYTTDIGTTNLADYLRIILKHNQGGTTTNTTLTISITLAMRESWSQVP